MSKGLDWRKARKIGPTEDKIGSGVAKPDGTRTVRVVDDDLATRAQREMIRWARTLKVKDRLSIPYPNAHQKRK